MYRCLYMPPGLSGTEGVRWKDDSCKMNQHPWHTHSDIMSCRTTGIQYMLTHTHRPRKSWAHSSEQQLQGRKWGQSIWRRAPLLLFNQTACSLFHLVFSPDSKTDLTAQILPSCFLNSSFPAASAPYFSLFPFPSLISFLPSFRGYTFCHCLLTASR